MKIRYLIFLFFSLPLFIFPQLASAHILKSDGNIGAVLHIDPDDDPIVGSQAGFFFEFKDKDNKFTPQNCECTFSILEDGRELMSQPLFQNSAEPSLTNASVFFTFPEKNVYQVKVVGKPNTSNAFQAFTLVYDIRVDREGSANSTNTNPNWFATHIPHVIGGILVGAFLIFALFKQLHKPKTL